MPQKRRKPLTAKVRRGLRHVVPLVSVNLDNGDAGDFQFLKRKDMDDIEAALAWIRQFAATGDS